MCACLYMDMQSTEQGGWRQQYLKYLKHENCAITVSSTETNLHHLTMNRLSEATTDLTAHLHLKLEESLLY